jgi:hypothetical protein
MQSTHLMVRTVSRILSTAEEISEANESLTQPAFFRLMRLRVNPFRVFLAFKTAISPL